MAINCQKQRFDLTDSVVYLNIASLSPSFKSVEKAGIEAVKDKSHPYRIPSSDFFDPVIELRKRFADIIDADTYERVVTIPSVSYGLANVANNITLKKDDEVIIIDEQFPSNVYVWKKLVAKYDAKLVVIKQPTDRTQCKRLWNEAILEAINDKTALIALGQIHWANGIVFDLKSIRQKTKQYNALMIIDGSQSVGAMPFSITDLQPDALVCAGYKWLFGPYGCAYAYYGPYFDNGNPIEENWSNRRFSENLSALTNYQDEYKPLANRYAVGENGSFIYVKMQLAALAEVAELNPKDIQDYCFKISEPAVKQLRSMGFLISNPNDRAHHLFGAEVPPGLDLKLLQEIFKIEDIHVSFRGNFMRLSCHIYNTEEDFKKLTACVSKAMQRTHG